MKKLFTAIMLIAMICTMFSGVSAYAAETPEDMLTKYFSETTTDGVRADIRYKLSVEYMNRQVTDPEKLELLLRPSWGIESNNEEIIALAKSITATLTDDYAKAQAINNWVRKNIYYDLDDNYEELRHTAFFYTPEYQSAVTTLNTKRGVCQGYTNLTCALLRAVGIPSQGYTGMAYNGESWGGHGWSGAYISSQKRWIVLDTTFDTYNTYSDGRYVSREKMSTYFDSDLSAFSQNHLYDHFYMPYTGTDFTFPNFTELSFGLDANFQFNASYPHPDEGTLENIEMGNRIMAGVEIPSYVSSNPKVATVDQMGCVTTHAYGTTTISAALVDGSGLIASYILTVEPQKLEGYVSFNGHNDVLFLGESYSALYKTESPFIGSNTTNDKYITWSSSNPKVATIDKYGQVTAIGPGTAKITASYSENNVSSSATTTVTVKPVQMGIKLSSKTLTLEPDRYHETISVKGNPEAYYPDEPSIGRLEWTSSNPQIVTVDKYSGFLTALKEGSATITVNQVEYNENGIEVVEFSDTCVVTVKVAAPELEPCTVVYYTQLDNAYKSLKFYANGETVPAGSKLTPPKAPTREGYTFDGWYVLHSEPERKWNFETDIVTEYVQFVARFKKGTQATPAPAVSKVNAIIANSTASKVLVNGKVIAFEAYNINGNNYFKLRDFAKVVSGTEKQFEVTWDGKNSAINLISNKSYTVTGGELGKGDGKSKTATVSTATIYKDGVVIPLTAYTINGNNYFKLRDVAQAFNIGVTWDGATSTVGIDTAIDYVP